MDRHDRDDRFDERDVRRSGALRMAQCDGVAHIDAEIARRFPGENETRLRQYLNPNGDSLVSFTTNGRLWAWSLDTRNDDVGPRNYVIRDSNCDGTFDEVYGLDDEFHVPDCARQPVHPAISP